jgi:hypothetical protein
MDGSAADGEHPFFSALLLAIEIRRLQRAGRPSQDGPSAEKDRQEVGQEIDQEIRPEQGQEGRQEGRPEILRQEDCQKISSQIDQEKRPKDRQAWQIGPEAGKERRPEALASD